MTGPIELARAFRRHPGIAFAAALAWYGRPIFWILLLAGIVCGWIASASWAVYLLALAGIVCGFNFGLTLGRLGIPERPTSRRSA